MSRYIYYLLIPCSENSKLLLTKSEGQWQLPYVESGIHYSECASYLINHIKQTYNLRSTILGMFDFQNSKETDTLSFYFIAETSFEVLSLSHDTGYFEKREIEELLSESDDQIQMIKRWFSEKEYSVSLQKPEWMKKCWFSISIGWIKQQLTSYGISTIINVEPVKLWYRSYVMRVDTNQGTFYFKAIPKGFKLERLLALDFAQQFPRNAPAIVAEDSERDWMLMKEITGRDLMDVNDEELWVKAVRDYARVQILYSTQVEKLINMGCMNRSLSSLPHVVKSFASEGLCMQPGLFGALMQDEINAFNSLIPQILEDCRKLEEYGIPDSLEHGDLTPRNVKMSDNSVIFFDWSDCSVSHPFFSLRALFGMLEVVFPNNNEIRNRLRDAYINEWASRGYGDVENLTKAFELADKLAPLHMSMTYHFQILPVVERKEECIGVEGMFIRWLLNQYNEDKSFGGD